MNLHQTIKTDWVMMLISFADEYDALAAEFVWGWGANPPIYLFFFVNPQSGVPTPPCFATRILVLITAMMMLG